MFYEYAIDPAILSDFERCRTFFESFKNRPSRLIADLPKKWIQEAFNAINQIPHEQCPPVRKKTLKENLKKILNINLCKNRLVEDWKRETNNWLEYAVNENSSYPFSAILGATGTSIPAPVYVFDNLFFDSPDCWEKPEQQHIHREAKIIVETILPLLKVSKHLLLVDPYFSFVLPSWNNYRPLLIELFSKVSEFNYGRGISKIDIHTSDRHGGVQQDLDSKVKPLLPPGLSIVCSQWPAHQMHDRFILTDVGGVFFGHGLGEPTDEGIKQVLVGALDYITYKNEMAKVTGRPASQSSV